MAKGSITSMSRDDLKEATSWSVSHHGVIFTLKEEQRSRLLSPQCKQQSFILVRVLLLNTVRSLPGLP